MRILIFTTAVLLSIITVLGIDIIVENNCETENYRTDKGSVCGTIQITESSNKYKAFYEIPFAEPPVGARRFLPPAPAQSWWDSGVLDASASQSIGCVQVAFETDDIAGQEDCLYLNLYAPVQAGEGPLPVMVWIYGGGFTMGSATPLQYGPQKFMDTNSVILVTFNYRLSGLGWLSVDSEEVQGNQGLYDMVAALSWVQDNVANFGGDPDQVTIFGESAGSWGASYLSVSPLARGLFSRAILQSGAWTNPYWRLLPMDEALRIGQYGAAKLNCSRATDAERLECLQNVDVGSILALNEDTFFYPPQAVFNSTMLPRLPHDLVSTGEINPEAIIVGANQDEGLLDTLNFILDPDLYEVTRNQWSIRGPMSEFGKRFQGNMTDITKQDVDQSLELLLHNVDSLENLDAEHLLNLTRMQTDVYWYGTQKLAEMVSEQGVAVYQYIFAYKGENGMLDFYGIDSTQYGVCHSDELYMFWNPYGLESYNLNENDKIMSDKMTQAWVDFACTGDPSPPGSSLGPWRPVTSDGHQYLRLDTEPRMEMSQDFADRVSFWRGIMAERPLP